MKRTLAWVAGLMICAAIAQGEVTVKVVTAPGPKAQPATKFAADVAAVHALFKTTGAQKGDKLRAVWIAEDIGEKAPANTKIDEKTLSLEGDTDKGDFSVTKPTNGWPAGKYRVEIYAGEKLATTAKFTIEDDAKATAPSAAAPKEKGPKVGRAKTVKFPEKDPDFTVEFPANWTCSPDKDGNLECKAGDDETYFCSLLTLDDLRSSTELKAALPAVAKAMADEMKLKNFELGDTSTDKNGEGVLFSGIMGEGESDGIDFAVMVHGFEAQKGKFYALVTAGTKESDAKHEKEYDEVTASITPIEE